MNKQLRNLWFVMGLGLSWRIVASLNVSEAIVLASAFFIVPNEYPFMKKSGVSTFFLLAVMVVFGCLVAVVANRTPLFLALRGFAATGIVVCSIPFSHFLIRKDPGGFKWMLLGLAISTAIKTFSVYFSGARGIMAYDPLFWKSRVYTFCMTPVTGWYLCIPQILCILLPFIVVVFSLTKTISGRGTALGCLFFVIIAFIGGHTRMKMSRFCRQFWWFSLCGMLLIFGLKSIYQEAAIKGWMGERATAKYHMQTKGGKSIGRLLLGGRGPSFVGLLACRDKPIVGFGPWAVDHGNAYRQEFLMKYGTEEDLNAFERAESNPNNYREAARLISCHSHITEFWLWYGIFGLFFWLYYMFVLIRYLKEDCYVVPQWFAWLACSIPGIFWDISFNPFSSRIVIPMYAVACLMARAIKRGVFRLPPDMLFEIDKAEGMAMIRGMRKRRG